MDVHTLGLGAAAKGAHDLRPNGAHGAKLRNLQEKVGSHGEAEHDLFRRIVDGNTKKNRLRHESGCRHIEL